MNDERPIEKLLRRFAKKRREEAGAPLEMHPATRQLLQGEVARQFRAAGAGKAASTGWWAALRQRWIYATAAMSAVVIAATLLVMNNNQPGVHDLAKQETAPAKSLAQKPVGELAKNFDGPAPEIAPTSASGVGGEKRVNAPALATKAKQKDVDEWKAPPAAATIAADAERSEAVADRGAATVNKTPARKAGDVYFAGKSAAQAPTTTTGNDKLEEAAGSRRLTTAPAAPAPVGTTAPAGQPTTATARSRQTTAGAFAKSSARRDAAVASAAPATPPPAGAPAAVFESRAFAPIARGGGLERDKQPVLSQSFANLAPAPKTAKAIKAAPAAAVLLNFQIEQAGNQLRVIDGDGSTYLGEVAAIASTIGDTKKGAEVLKTDGKLLFTPPAQNVAANNFYRVTGTNRTLNQQVVFTWNYIELTNAPGQTQAVSGLLKNQTVNTMQQVPALFNNSGISGRAQINAAKEIEINAVPVNQ